jgi:acetyl-CoA carboxylase biotin carboxylase subunit
MSAARRAEMGAAAVAAAKAVGYVGAGTVEFIAADSFARDGAFYFMEMNTRLQVEHPVTEMITGLDLVQEMLRIAGGEPLSVRQDDIKLSGHAIECRINAEDPHRNFMPGPGLVSRLVAPQGEGVRFDTMLFEGYTVPPFYDSLLGKLIVHGADRAQCLERLRKALNALTVAGVPTTIPLHAALAADAEVAAGRFDTRFLEKWLETKFAAPGSAREVAL